MAVSWAGVRQRHIEAVGADVVIGRSSEMVARARAHALADVRRRKGFLQRPVADAMGVSVARVSRIERGDLSDLEVLSTYVQALGGELKIVATFGDEQLRVG